MTFSYLMSNKNQRKAKGSNFQPAVIDFGIRKISSQNFSKIVTIPRDALRNCGDGKAMSVNVKLVQDKGEKYIKLIPRCEQKRGRSK